MEKNYKILKKMIDADQKDRKDKRIAKLPDKRRWQIISKRDEKRVNTLEEILKTETNWRGIDCFRIGLLLQHSPTLESKKKVIKFAKKGIKLGNKKCKWLFAAGIDRLLMMQSKKQKYGTQYVKKGKLWELYPINPKTTDEERSKYNIKPLKQIIARVADINRDQKILTSKIMGLSAK